VIENGIVIRLSGHRKSIIGLDPGLPRGGGRQSWNEAKSRRERLVMPAEAGIQTLFLPVGLDPGLRRCDGGDGKQEVPSTALRAVPLPHKCGGGKGSRRVAAGGP
jgi:hypothetical protein